MPSDESPRPPPTGRALHEAKHTTRARCLARRDAMPERYRAAASATIAAGIARLPCWVEASTVLLTLPFRSEWDSRLIVDAALAAGKRVALPRVDPRTRTLGLYVVRDPDTDVEPGFQQIPEPRDSCPVLAPSEVGWVLVPGVAFDARGVRLGYGGGFYDRLLPLLPPSAARVAGAFELQLVDGLPTAPHDARVDRIVTESRTLLCGHAVGERAR